jgi:hypothetical protein
MCFEPNPQILVFFKRFGAMMQIFVKLQAKCMQRVTLTLPLQCGDFNNELEILYARMATQVVLVLKPSFDFVVHFNQDKIHNVMAIMLVPHFKRLLCC